MPWCLDKYIFIYVSAFVSPNFKRFYVWRWGRGCICMASEYLRINHLKLKQGIREKNNKRERQKEVGT